MKRNSIQFLIVLTLLLFGGAIYADLVAPAITISGDQGGIELSPVALSPGAATAFKTWGPEEKRKQSIEVYLPMKSNEWSKAWISFKADKDGVLVVNLSGSYKLVNGKKQRINVLFDDITVEASTIKNGNFESAKGKLPLDWYPTSQDENGPRYLAILGVNGSACVMTWHGGGFSQSIPCVKDTVITIRLSCKLADAKDEAAPLAGGGAEPVKRVGKPNNLPDTFVNISSAANMGFAYDKAGDGKGGWSDQGSQSDFSGFDTSRTDYRGVLFSIIDPRKNDGRAVLTFKSDNISPEIKLDRVTFQTGGAKAQYLYLLHTACFVHNAGETVGTVTIKTKSGRTVEHKLTTGRDLADWWDPGYLPNGLVAYRKQNKSANVGLYLSKFAVGEDAEEIESVTFATAGKAIWIVAGATLSGKDIDFTLPKFTIKNGEGWKPVDMSNTIVAEKSALDFSSLVEPGPAGKHGRVIVNSKGQLAFADNPDVPVRFFAFNNFVNHTFGYPEIKLGVSDEAQTKLNIERYAQAVRRQGYNMARYQGVDIFLAAGIKSDFEFNEVNLDRLCYLIYCLKREGVYLNIDLWSYNGYLKGAWDEIGKRGLYELLLVDPASRLIWETGIRKLMSHRNPYTGTTLAEEKAIALVTMCNEQDIPVVIDVFNNPKVKPAATERWREFLRKRYDMAGLEQAWGKKFPPGTTIDSLPLFSKGSEWGRGAHGTDVGTFIYERQRDLLLWYQETLRSTGYTGLSGQYDVIKYYRDDAARNASPVIFMHGYHNHPTDISDGPGSRMGQDGSIQTSANYWRTQAAARFLNRPMCITEYGIFFWHRYRHEEALIYPAYSALQDFSAITVHAQAVIMQLNTPLASGLVGRDPVLRASQVLAALIYARRDVAPSPHTVALAINNAYIFTNGNMNYGVNSDQSKIALLCRFGLQYDAPIPSGLPPYPKADMTVPPADGAAMVASQWAASVLDNATGKDLDVLIDAMKTRGVLSKDNQSNALKGIFQSDTKEIVMNVPEEQLTVITPRLEGIILKDNKSAALNAIKNVSTTVAAAVGVASLDNTPLAQSRRLLIVYSTDALNSGFEATDDRVTIVKAGKLPVLMQTGILKINLGTTKGAGMTLWALGIDGTRKEKLPLTQTAADEVRITIDTAALKNGPTPFFELVTE